MLMPVMPSASSVKPTNDQDDYVMIPSPQGNGSIKAYLRG